MLFAQRLLSKKVFLFCLILLLSYSWSKASTDWFYYSEGKRNYLALSTEKIAVKFEQGVSGQRSETIISSIPAIMSPPQKEELTKLNVSVFLIRPGVTEEGILISIKALSEFTEVESATPVFTFEDVDLILTNEFVVKSRPRILESEIDELNRKHSVKILRKYSWLAEPVYILKVTKESQKNALEMANIYYEERIIDFAHPNFIRRLNILSTIPDDTYFWDQWGLHNTGQSGGTPDADIDAPEAWDLGTGRDNITIAVIDEGTDISHEDLVPNLVTGYDATDGDNDPTPNSWDGHGTACAGIVAAMSNNMQGVAGVAWHCKIMPIRVAYSEYPGAPWTTTDEWIADGIRSAVNRGADILSNSWGGGSPSDIINAAISFAKTDGRGGKGCVILFASGNYLYGGPVAYPAYLDEVLAVGATDHDDVVWYYSGHGAELDVVAPSGDVNLQGNIWTTDISGAGGYNPGDPNLGDPAGHYTSKFGGTSAACPLAAGVAGLILSVNANLTSDEVQAVIENTGEDLGDPGWDEYYGHGRINAYDALESLGSYVSGDVSGTWTAENSPYYVTGEIRVPPGQTLIIEPGVTVNFMGHYKFIVNSNATLRAIGTESDSIIFTTDDPETGWHGIRFCYASDNSQLFHCRIEYGKATGDYPDDRGGAIDCDRSSPIISHNTISDNSATIGGGICCFYSDPTISNNTISGNSVTHYGGGVYCVYSDPTINNNTISGNSAHHDGAGIYCWLYSSPTITDNEIIDNTSDRVGGAIYCYYNSSPIITHNRISNNSGTLGGGIYCGGFYSSPKISNNTITGNSSAWYGGGIYCDDSSPTISNNTITDNWAMSEGGGIHCHDSSPTISHNIITDNSTDDCGGGIFATWSSNPTISGNTISGNSAGFGGGIYCEVNSSPAIGYNVISFNSADSCGGAIYCGLYTNPSISNNTITRNSASSGGGIFCEEEASPTAINTILWGDSASLGPEIYVEGGNPSVTYCDVQGGWEGEGNIDCDPYFCDPEAGDYYLAENSCCVGAGQGGVDIGALGVGCDPLSAPEASANLLPSDFALYSNYPNPFNPFTTFEYALPVRGYVRLEVFNLSGQRVVTLLDEFQMPGYKTFNWEASNLASGIYFYRLTAGDFSETRRMTILK